MTQILFVICYYKQTLNIQNRLLWTFIYHINNYYLTCNIKETWSIRLAVLNFISPGTNNAHEIIQSGITFPSILCASNYFRICITECLMIQFSHSLSCLSTNHDVLLQPTNLIIKLVDEISIREHASISHRVWLFNMAHNLFGKQTKVKFSLKKETFGACVVSQTLFTFRQVNM